MDGPILRRAIVFIAVGWVLLIYGMRVAQGQIWSPLALDSEIPLVLLDAELLPCAELGPDAVMVPICEAAWAQSRSRFPGPYDEEDVSSACIPHILRVEGP